MANAIAATIGDDDDAKEEPPSIIQPETTKRIIVVKKPSRSERTKRIKNRQINNNLSEIIICPTTKR
jgi:hypothetical protein